MNAVKLLDHVVVNKEECSDILFFLRKYEQGEDLSDSEKNELSMLLTNLGTSAGRLFLG